MIALFVVGYFAIGISLFFGFWRWLADGDDDSGDQFMCLMLLFLWPGTLALIGFVLSMEIVLDLGKKVMKK